MPHIVNALLKQLQYLDKRPLAIVSFAFSFSFLLLFSPSLIGQPFQMAIGDEGLDKARVMEAIPGGGLVIGGETDRKGTDETDDLLVKINDKGAVQWAKSYGGIERETINDLTLTPDNGFLLSAEKYKLNASDGEFLQLIKTDPSGNMQWKKTYDEGGSELEGYSINTLSNGGYLVSGLIKNLSTASNVFYTMKKEQQSLYLLKTDNSGNKKWSGTLTLGDEEKFAATGLSSLELEDDHYLTAGYLIREGKNESVPQKPVKDYDNKRLRKILLLKNGPDGSLQWAKTFPGFRNAAAYSMVKGANGDLMMAGVTLNRNTKNTQIAVMRTDRNGRVKWTKNYNLNGYQSVASIREASNGNFIIAGLTRHQEDKLDDAYLLKIDGSGKLLWAKGIGADNNELLSSLTIKGGWIYYAGATLSDPAQNLDILVGRTNGKGDINCRAADLPVETQSVDVTADEVQDAEFKKLVFDEPSEAMRPKSSQNVEQSAKEVQQQNICAQ